ncbi:glycoside hydrolase, family 43 [Thermotoga petrophila RKU-1]|uniref:Extracellular endo-alpha-(1->5)-L-arabinanase n=1 Tax=Thermotoga petrophila (strain ATCC BAA-488 / DSM 13995 / JCM 10881 / RKU-1) TaxID=390874 RepID=EABN_THEP1|nr:arabinan endo-1,5-alpha-L-arabinosidase [Thermotoga petrophila]A5IKD4.1 RecName: Full=Extracellular endo-alpha-(1->5)-L-arabinanase; Short=ABN; AltName: Full=Endo-1,5-alpha-L-arabinanase; Flags: Precursor [Thermotoga petrophila RKU-1]ABQ46657.1 glycoside hydrolase, family 43 [Thermotoga petrophila RKU-1]
MRFLFLMITLTALTGYILADEQPTFRWAVVHDPSIIKVGNMYYVFGTHLQVAKSKDLMHWEQINTSAHDKNPIIPNINEELKETLSWARTRNDIWAPQVIQLSDGRYYMYYCASTFGSPRSAIGIAVSDDIEGPYKHYAVIVKSGQVYSVDGPSEDGTPYDSRKHPNALDPGVFYDKEGNLWMVYGSWFGGIYILKLDPNTGLPLPGQGYGKRLVGGNHSSMEGPYILYSPDTDYYYLFLSFGGLDYRGGYNIRVARSKNPNGPYYDPEGKSMENCMGSKTVISNYGAKLVGNFILSESNTIDFKAFGYVSPGHNSAYYDPETGKYFIFFHTRFPGRGETYQLRVHQLFLNEDGWFVMAPFPYGGETVSKLPNEEIVGEYQFINHGKEITDKIKQPVRIKLNSDGSITGAVEGRWERKEHYITLKIIEGNTTVIYKGVLLKQWHYSEKKWVTVFTALSNQGVSVWGIRVEE